jgi:hypothetical protein
VRSFAQAPSNLLICKEVFVSVPFAMYTRKNFYLLDSINDKIDMLKTSGIINYWYYEPLKKKIFTNNSPKVLSLQSFIGSFQLFVFGHFLSAFIFVGEIIAKFITRKRVKTVQISMLSHSNKTNAIQTGTFLSLGHSRPLKPVRRFSV